MTGSTEVNFSTADHRWMQHALQLAKNGLGYVEPNPMVGCVLVRDGELIASGFHAKFGGPHAEQAAIEQAKQEGKAGFLAGATAYVTLEPCCHHGKTPPCANALLDVGIQRVVAAMQDPFPKVAGQGIARLRASGVSVELGLEQDVAVRLNAAYLKRLQTGRPWVIAKWAMSLDGKIATAAGHSQWISGEASRATVHQMRGRVDAIIVGRGTAQADDPLLTARLSDRTSPPRTALRVVVDSNLSLNPGCKLVQTAKQYPSLFWTSPTASPTASDALQQLGVRVERSDFSDRGQSMDQLLQFLAKDYAATNVLVEGGGQLLGSLFDLRQIDQCEIFIAPKLIGGSGAKTPIAGLGIQQVPDGPTCSDISWQPSGDDQHFSCRLQWS